MFFRKQTPQQFSITIPEPCSEKWGGMHVVDDVQRHCDSCAKNVIDFSQMSDDEMLLFFRNSGANICGRFRKDQLHRPYTFIPQATRPAQWWKAVALLPLTLFGKNLTAQSDSITPPDSLQTMNDTLAPLTEIVNDSAIAEVDSTTEMQDTVVVVSMEDPVVHATPEKIITVRVEDFVVGAMGQPPPVVYGNMCRTPLETPRLTFVPISDWIDRLLYKKGDDAITTSNPEFAVTEDPNQPKPDPVPPTLPERPWYEAILPRSWRIRKS